MILFAASAALATPTVAQVEVRYPEGGLEPLVLVQREVWKDRALAEGPAQRDEISTMLTPSLVRARGTETFRLTGYRLGEHEQPGDTLVTYELLIELAPGRVEGFWYENHMEVPTSLWAVSGTWDPQTLELQLQLAGQDGQGPAAVAGVLRPGDGEGRSRRRRARATIADTAGMPCQQPPTGVIASPFFARTPCGESLTTTSRRRGRALTPR